MSTYESPLKSVTETQSGGHNKTAAGIGFAILYVLLSAFVMGTQHGRIEKLEASQATMKEDQQSLSARLDSSESTLQSTIATLNDSYAQTDKKLQDRAQEIQRQHKATVSRLMKQQTKQLEAVNGDLAGVRTEVGDVKSQVASAQSGLQDAQSKLDRAIGDLGMQSGQIATTREELEKLRQKGEKNYYEFALLKGKSPTVLATVGLQLRKVDVKKGKFTLNVVADDRTIEKKDRTMFEPLQFYTGKGHRLYEVVVFTAEKDKVTGYLATPKEQIVADSR